MRSDHHTTGVGREKRLSGPTPRSPFWFCRAYAAGLEPATSIPNAGLGQAIENGTARTLPPDGTEQVSIKVAVSSTDE